MYKISQFRTGILFSKLTALILFSGCQKDPTQPSVNDPINSGPTALSGFTWTPAGSSPVVANDFYFIAAYNNIVATKTGNLTSVDIILDDFSIGTHALSPSKGVTLEYVVSGTTYSAKSGGVTITKNNGTHLSGSFTAALTGGTLSALSGEFADVPAN